MAIKREWYNLAGAAARLGCSEDDVLHLAATNQLRVCIFVAQRVSADWCEVDDGVMRLPPKRVDVSLYHRFVGLPAPAAQDLATHGRTEVASFNDLLYPNHALRLHKARPTNEQPRLPVARSEVQVREVDIAEYEAESRGIASQPPAPPSKAVQDAAFDAAISALGYHDIHNLPPRDGKDGVPAKLWRWFQESRWKGLWRTKKSMDTSYRGYLERHGVKPPSRPTSGSNLRKK